MSLAQAKAIHERSPTNQFFDDGDPRRVFKRLDRTDAKLVRIDRLTELAKRDPGSIWEELLDVELSTSSRGSTRTEDASCAP